MKPRKHPLHIALNTWIVIALSGILTTLAACQAPTTQPKPVQAPSPAQTPTFPNTVANTNTPHNNPKVPVKTFALPADTKIPTDLTQGEQRILYVDPKNGNRIILTTPQKQEAFKDFAVKQLLPPAQQPYPLNTVDVGQIESVINVRHNPNYCKVYELKVERPQKPLRDQNLCDNLRYKVVINGEPWAELIATDVFFSAPPSGVAATVGENRYVFAPCEEACDQPLKVEIFKSPGEACALKNAIDQNSPGLRKNPAGYTGLDSMDKVTEFDYDDCQNREILDLYYDCQRAHFRRKVLKRVDKRDLKVQRHHCSNC